MKEQQITEEKPLLPEQRGPDSDAVSRNAFLPVFSGWKPSSAVLLPVCRSGGPAPLPSWDVIRQRSDGVLR